MSEGSWITYSHTYIIGGIEFESGGATFLILGPVGVDEIGYDWELVGMSC